MNRTKANLTVIEGKKVKNSQIRVNFDRIRKISDYCSSKTSKNVSCILFFSCIFPYTEQKTNKITAPLEDILKSASVPKKHRVKLISILEEIKAIIPSKDKTEYLLNPWIANGFDENNFKELMSLFPNIDILTLKVIDGGKE